jgi:predicted ribosomally synthesized peptide with SipW-like signal peptide
MNRKVRLSTLIVLAVLMLSLLIGGLYGVFQDTETSNENTFTVGTLNLVSVIDGSGYSTLNERADGLNDNITFDMVAPGDNGSVTWALTNDGNLDGNLTMASVVTFAENVANEPEIAAGAGGLNQYMGVRLMRDGSYILGITGYVPFSGLETVLDAQNQTLAASGTITYVLEWQIQSDIETAGDDGVFDTNDANEVDVDDNKIQSDSANIDITFTLTQV